MEWKDLAGTVGKAAPMLGTLIGGPAGRAVGGLIASVLGTGNTPEDVAAAVANTESLVKLREIEAKRQTDLEALLVDQGKAELAAHTAQVQAVNQTMQEEAKADHWPTYCWRPFIGFVFGGYVASMFILPLFHVQPVPLSPDLTLTVGTILGVASFFRGKMQADPGVKSDNRG